MKKNKKANQISETVIGEDLTNDNLTSKTSNILNAQGLYINTQDNNIINTINGVHLNKNVIRRNSKTSPDMEKRDSKKSIKKRKDNFGIKNKFNINPNTNDNHISKNTNNQSNNIFNQNPNIIQINKKQLSNNITVKKDKDNYKELKNYENVNKDDKNMKFSSLLK